MTTQRRTPTGTISIGNTGFWYLADGVTHPTTSNAHLQVDDPIGSPDDDATYLRAWTGVFETIAVSYVAFNITASAIQDVSIHTRHRISSTGYTSRPGLKTTNTVFSNGTPCNATSWYDQTDVFTTNPDTGAAWTEAQVEGRDTNNNFLGTAFRHSTNATYNYDVTQQYVEVNFTGTDDDGGGGGTPSASIPAMVANMGRMP